MDEIRQLIRGAVAGSHHLDEQIAKIAGYDADFSTSLDAVTSLIKPAYLRLEPIFYDDEGEVKWRAYSIQPKWNEWSHEEDWFDTFESIRHVDPCLAALDAWAQSQIPR